MALLKSLGNYKDFGLLVIRVGLGILFIYHGLPKLIGGPARWEHLGNAAGSVGIHFLPTFWGFACALTETLGGVLVIVGLAFRVVCIFLVFDLIVAAVFTYHVDGVSSQRPMPSKTRLSLPGCCSLVLENTASINDPS